ncbi:STAS domain-containing protein [Streptomyces sp. NPDC095613]|uniref:STAS domain-containing protein n=1 Tax=Streptomyces sp. NPDC095613 TaxID=3155540 RepID=UPI003325757F
MSSGCVAGLFRVDATEPILLALVGTLTPADVPRLCAELSLKLRDTPRAPGDDGPRGDTGPPGDVGRPWDDAAPEVVHDVVCDVTRLDRANLAAVDALARLRLTALRHGRRLRLVGAGRELRLLLDLVGLAEVAEAQPFEPSGDPPRPHRPPL